MSYAVAKDTAVVITIGPLLDETDGVTPITSPTLGDITAAIIKGGGTSGGPARSTITIAFQRIRLLILRSRSRSPGYGGSRSTGIVFTYGVFNPLRLEVVNMARNSKRFPPKDKHAIVPAYVSARPDPPHPGREPGL